MNDLGTVFMLLEPKIAKLAVERSDDFDLPSIQR